MTLGQFSVSACANQATDFSVSGSLIPNGLFQAVNGLLENFAIYHLPDFKKFFSFSFSSISPAIGMLKSVRVWPQLHNEVSTWYP